MYGSAADAYLECSVLAADPLELVRLLYRAALDAISDARRCLAAGDIAGRGRAINKATEVVIELASSLDRERGGDIALRLARLYEYAGNRLLEAHLQQSDALLAEVAEVLAVLAQAWAEIAKPAQSRPQAEQPPVWAQQPPAEAAEAYSSHAWSF